MHSSFQIHHVRQRKHPSKLSLHFFHPRVLLFSLQKRLHGNLTRFLRQPLQRRLQISQRPFRIPSPLRFLHRPSTLHLARGHATERARLHRRQRNHVTHRDSGREHHRSFHLQLFKQLLLERTPRQVRARRELLLPFRSSVSRHIARHRSHVFLRQLIPDRLFLLVPILRVRRFVVPEKHVRKFHALVIFRLLGFVFLILFLSCSRLHVQTPDSDLLRFRRRQDASVEEDVRAVHRDRGGDDDFEQNAVFQLLLRDHRFLLLLLFRRVRTAARQQQKQR